LYEVIIGHGNERPAHLHLMSFMVRSYRADTYVGSVCLCSYVPTNDRRRE